LRELLPEDRYKHLVAENGETLAKTVVLISKHTQHLIEKETHLRIDSDVIELEQSYQEKFLAEARKKLLEYSDFKVLEPELKEVSVEGESDPSSNIDDTNPPPTQQA